MRRPLMLTVLTVNLALNCAGTPSRHPLDSAACYFCLCLGFQLSWESRLSAQLRPQQNPNPKPRTLQLQISMSVFLSAQLHSPSRPGTPSTCSIPPMSKAIKFSLLIANSNFLIVQLRERARVRWPNGFPSTMERTVMLLVISGLIIFFLSLNHFALFPWQLFQ